MAPVNDNPFSHLLRGSVYTTPIDAVGDMRVTYKDIVVCVVSVMSDRSKLCVDCVCLKKYNRIEIYGC